MDRVAHIDVRRAMSIFARSTCAPSSELTGTHAPRTGRGSRRRCARDTGFHGRARSACRGIPDLFGRQAVDVSLAGLDQVLGTFVELLEIIRGVKQPRASQSKPSQRTSSLIDSVYSRLSFSGLVSSKRRLALTAEILRDSEIQADRLGVADMQVAVRLRRETGMQAAFVLAGGQIAFNDLANEIGGLALRSSFMR
jgi:hypothetical protein